MQVNDQELQFQYRNYRGENSERRVIPNKIWFGTTEYHTEPQWLMTAYDIDKRDVRDFALLDCKFKRD